MDPITLAVGAAAISGIVQAYNGEKARGANKAKMKQLEELFKSIVPPQYDVSLNDPPAYITEKLGDANLDFSKITPEQFKVMGQYAPEAASYVAEINPTLIARSETGKQGLSAQLDALREYKKIAQGDDPAFAARLGQANTAAQAAAQSRSNTAIQQAQRMGTFGSGQGFASILQGNSDAMMQGGAAGRDAAIASNQNRMNALGQSASLGGQIAGQDLSMQQSNADIINQFNQRTSKNYQAYLNNRQALANEAQLFNLKNSQDVANQNVSQNNDTNRFNLTNRNALSQQAYANKVNERGYQNSIAESLAKWNASEKDRVNSLSSQSYNDQIARAQGIAGIGTQGMQMNNQNAADRNQIIAGVTGAVTGGLMNQYAADQENARWDKYINARKAGY